MSNRHIVVVKMADGSAGHRIGMFSDGRTVAVDKGPNGHLSSAPPRPPAFTSRHASQLLINQLSLNHKGKAILPVRQCELLLACSLVCLVVPVRAASSFNVCPLIIINTHTHGRV